jgi:LuxR family maltose regulon positive regulatory protein
VLCLLGDPVRGSEMSAPLLKTKLFIPPVRPELVSRPRLIGQLNAAMARKLTLVSAPAGYGKTTLLSEWIHQRGNGSTSALPVAWLSLDPSDNDPNRFLSYMIYAAQTIVPSVGEGLLASLQSSQPPPAESVLSSLINELAATPKTRDQCCLLGLVLDDYHLIDNPQIHQALAFLLDHVPPPPEGLHFVVASRKDPLLPLPRLRAGAQMSEVREADLRFTFEETAQFLNRAMGLGLSSEQMSALQARTEGWISGLQLAALSMQGMDATQRAHFVDSFTGADRHIVDYLVDEVLDQRPEGTKDFLLETSILERMSGPLCDAVRLAEGGQPVLEALDRANLFVVPLDNQRQWYRYHHLFADLLRHRLRAMVGSQGLAVLHSRASEWYEQNQFATDAVHHAFAAGEMTRAARLVERNARHMFARSELKTLMGWVDALPAALVRLRPWLCVFYAWALRLTGGEVDAVESRLQMAELALAEAESGLPAEQVTVLRGHMASLRGYQALYREEIPRVIELSRQALDSLPDTSFARGLTALALGWALRFSGDLTRASQAFAQASSASLASGNTYGAVAATSRRAYTEMLAGRLRQAADICQEAVQMATGAGGRVLPVAGYALVYLGLAYREWNNLDAAARHLVQGSDLCGQVGYIMDQVVAHATLARVLHAQGDAVGARQSLQNAEELSLKMRGYVLTRRWVEDAQVRLLSTQGRLSDLAHWIQQTDLRVDDSITFGRELEHIVLARALVVVGRERTAESYLDDALALLARLLQTAESKGWMGKAIEILALQALAFQARDRGGEALDSLERALSLAEPEGYVRVFLDEGAPMARLLSEAAARDIAPAYVHSLLAAITQADPDGTLASQRSVPPTGLLDPLTARELEVLKLIADGLSNRQIADRLVLVVSTVKVHTRSIYAKLDVNSRTQAVAVAQRLGLL